MIVLVIGKQGQVASSLAEINQSPTVRIIAVGRPTVDLLQPESLLSAVARLKPDIVVNAAAYTAVDRSERERGLAFAVNADGPAHLAAACASRNIPIIHLSTDYVYDGAKDSPYLETDRPRPLSVYGLSKLAGEQRLASANPRHIILRTAWVHSPFGSNFVKTMLRLAGTQSQIDVVNDQLGSPTYAIHLAEAIIAMASQIVDASHFDARWGVYHAVNRGETTWFGFAHTIFESARRYGYAMPKIRPITAAEYPTDAMRPRNSALDASKLKHAFAITMPEWREGVGDCLRLIALQTNGRIERCREKELEPRKPAAQR